MTPFPTVGNALDYKVFQQWNKRQLSSLFLFVVFKSNYTLIICTTTGNYCARLNTDQELCLSNTYLSAQSSSFKQGLNMVFKECTTVQLRGKSLWLWNPVSLCKYWSAVLACTKCWRICHWCQLHLSVKSCWFRGAGAAACPRLSPQVSPGEGIGSQRIRSGAQPRAAPTPRCWPWVLLPDRG